VRLTLLVILPSNRLTDMGAVLRVASYNLRDLKDDADAAARVVRAINPDVLCLQEVPRHLLAGYRIAWFAARCGLYWSGGHRGSGGTTVMSGLRLNAANVRPRSLKVPALQRERGYAATYVRVPGHQSIGVASIHLSLNAAERAAHAATLLSDLPEDQALVVAGDLNEGIDGDAATAIAARLRTVSDDRPTFPAGNPRHRLDVIFASPTLPVIRSGSTAEPVRADLVAATDHLPVWVDLDLSLLGHPEAGRLEARS
jgi:endonuclease/exonuclease/phosphatase family metal-dependent hydrolase